MGTCRGLEILEVHYEGNGLDLAIGRSADGSDTSVTSPVIGNSVFPSGLTLDRAYKPTLMNPIIGDGTGVSRVFTLTSNCTYPVIINGPKLETNCTISDASGSPTVISDLNGRTGFGTLAPQQSVHLAGNRSLLLDNNTAVLRIKDAGGSARRILFMAGSNAVYVGDADNSMSPSDLLLNAGGATGIIKGLVNGADTFYVRAGNVDATAADLRVVTAGKGLKVKEGSNAKQGASTLVAGSVVVSNTSVTANSRILLTSNTDGGTPGWLRVSARTVGTSFTITSSSGTDTSTVAWQIFEPA
jgi:hypothetical protein